MKIRKCCQNCKHYERCDYWESYDKTDCKHFKTDLDRLAEVYVIDEELK